MDFGLAKGPALVAMGATVNTAVNPEVRSSTQRSGVQISTTAECYFTNVAGKVVRNPISALGGKSSQ